MNIFVNGKKCVTGKKKLAQWEIDNFAGIERDFEERDYARRYLFVAADGIPEMLGRYDDMPVHEGMHINIIYLNEFAQVRDYKKKDGFYSDRPRRLQVQLN